MTRRDINRLWSRLQGGQHIEVRRNDGEMIGLIVKASDGFIHYRHYGQSAVKNTPERLAWVIENIFTTYKSLENYISA